MPLIIPSNSSSAAGFTIDQSIRFNSNDSAYMYRNVDAPAFGNKYTMSFWAKFTNSDDYRRIITFRDKRGNGYPFGFLRLEKSDDSSAFQLTIFEYDTAISSNYPIYVVSAMKFRDYSAWYHIVVSVDYTRPVADRCRLYVNGTQQTFSYNANSASSGTPQSQASGSGANYWQIGRLYVLSTYPGDYYLAEIHVVDGNAYGPEFFGETNDSGIWIPKEFEGSHGSGGFFIDGRDSSDLGDDESGNGNDFTTTGLAAHDQMVDSPTNNFCNGLPTGVGTATGVTFSDGNLTGKTSGTAGNWVSSIPVDSGKWYFEVNNHAQGSGNNLGIGQTPSGSYHHFASGSGGNQINDYDIVVNTGASGSIVGFKLDFDAGTLTHTTDGTSYSSTGSLTAGMSYAAFARLGSSSGHVVFNFGQDSTFGGLETAGGNSDSNGIGDFYYNVPSGFKAICTKNLGS